MCSVISLLIPATWLLIAVSFVMAATYFGLFQSRLCEHHKSTWGALTQEKILFDDSDRNGAIASRYFLSGKWKTLGDETISMYAAKTWMANAGGISGVIALILVEHFAPEASLLACFRR